MFQARRRTKPDLGLDIVTIPFLPQFREGILEQRITLTARARRYGVAGEDLRISFTRLEFQIVYIRLLEVKITALGNVAYGMWRRSGARSSEHYEDIWCRLHSRKRFDPNQQVHLHRFRLLTEKEVRNYV